MLKCGRIQYTNGLHIALRPGERIGQRIHTCTYLLATLVNDLTPSRPDREHRLLPGPLVPERAQIVDLRSRKRF